MTILGCQMSIRELELPITGNSKSKEDAPMNFEKAVEEFEGDREFLMEALEGFLRDVRARIGTIRQAISDGDAESVKRGPFH